MALAQAFHGVLAANQPIPAGIDGGRLALVALKGNITYEQLRAMIGAGAQSFNEEMVTALGDLFYPTTKIDIKYPNGGTLPTLEATSGGARASLIRANVIGHMIDRQVYTYAIGGDWRAMEDADPEYILAEVRAGNQMLRNLWESKLLTRMLNNSENALGATPGYDVGWCDGSTGLQYAPEQWGGQVFLATHQHYTAYDSTVTNPVTGVNYTLFDAINLTAKNISEHGVVGLYKAYVSESNVQAITALSQFVRLVRLSGTVIDKGGLTTGNIYTRDGEMGATPGMGGRPIGSIQTDYGEVELVATYRIPSGYGTMYRPGAQGNVQNALAVNYRPSFGLGVKILEIPDFNTTFPLKEVDLELEFGVSCGASRFAGAAWQFGSGNAGVYSNPTIS